MNVTRRGLLGMFAAGAAAAVLPSTSLMKMRPSGLLVPDDGWALDTIVWPDASFFTDDGIVSHVRHEEVTLTLAGHSIVGVTDVVLLAVGQEPSRRFEVIEKRGGGVVVVREVGAATYRRAPAPHDILESPQRRGAVYGALDHEAGNRSRSAAGDTLDTEVGDPTPAGGGVVPVPPQALAERHRVSLGRAHQRDARREQVQGDASRLMYDRRVINRGRG